MKNILLLLLTFFISNTYSQITKGIILDTETKTPIEKAHIFLANKVVYSNSKGEFKFNLKGKEKIEFTITHIQYQTQKFTYRKSDNKAIFYLKEKQETLESISIKSLNKYKSSLNYKKLKDLPEATSAFASIIKDDKIYVFGGDASSVVEKNKEGLFFLQNSNEEEILRFLNRSKPISFNEYKSNLQTFNLQNNKWSNTKEKLIKRANHKAIVYKNKVFIIGGKSLSKKKSRELLENNIEVVSLKDLSIEKDKTNPHKAVDFGSVLYEDKIIVFGGSIKKYKNGKKAYSDKVNFYDINTGLWYNLTTMSKGKEVSGIVFKDKLYLFGGFNNKDLTEIESFNFKTGKWKKEGDLFTGMKKPTITIDKEFIYLQEDGKIVTFEPSTNRLKEYSIDIHLKDSEMHFYNESLYIVGGYHVEDFRKFPSKGFYKVNTSEFYLTKPLKVKTLIN